jgi:hypothetical protein
MEKPLHFLAFVIRASRAGMYPAKQTDHLTSQAPPVVADRVGACVVDSGKQVARFGRCGKIDNWELWVQTLWQKAYWRNWLCVPGASRSFWEAILAHPTNA